METIKDHKCPSCGGNLVIDNERQIYLCKFCGSTYDYEYFREDNAINMGQTYLNRGEYDAAKDLYRFMLAKDPHDFRALRGLMFASARCNSMEDLMKLLDSDKFDYDEESVGLIKNSCAEEDKEYFDEFADIYSNIKEAASLNKELNNLRQERKKTEDKIQNEHGKIKENMIIDRGGVEHDPKTVFITMWVISALLILLTAGGAFALAVTCDEISSAVSVAVMGGIMCLVLLIINYTISYPKFKAVRQINGKLNKLYEESSKYQEKIDKLRDEIDGVSSRTKHACLAFSKKDANKEK